MGAELLSKHYDISSDWIQDQHHLRTGWWSALWCLQLLIVLKFWVHRSYNCGTFLTRGPAAFTSSISSIWLKSFSLEIQTVQQKRGFSNSLVTLVCSLQTSPAVLDLVSDSLDSVFVPLFKQKRPLRPPASKFYRPQTFFLRFLEAPNVGWASSDRYMYSNQRETIWLGVDIIHQDQIWLSLSIEVFPWGIFILTERLFWLLVEC